MISTPLYIAATEGSIVATKVVLSHEVEKGKLLSCFLQSILSPFIAKRC